MSAAEANLNPSEEPTFEQTLQTLEANVTRLKERHAQIQQDQARQTELQTRQAELNQRPELTTEQPALTTELDKIETELQELELRLESQLFSWDSWKQYFWQTVRFIGLGVAIGWGLAFYVMKHPVPGAIEPNQPEQVR